MAELNVFHSWSFFLIWSNSRLLQTRRFRSNERIWEIIIISICIEESFRFFPFHLIKFRYLARNCNVKYHDPNYKFSLNKYPFKPSVKILHLIPLVFPRFDRAPRSKESFEPNSYPTHLFARDSQHRGRLSLWRQIFASTEIRLAITAYARLESRISREKIFPM